MATTDNNSTAPDQNNSTTQEHSHTCNDPSHHHDHPPLFDPNDLLSSLTLGKSEPVPKRKGKKNSKQASIRAELIPGHRGSQDIDDLVNFINGPSTNEKKPKKKSSTGTN